MERVFGAWVRWIENCSGFVRILVRTHTCRFAVCHRRWSVCWGVCARTVDTDRVFAERPRHVDELYVGHVKPVLHGTVMWSSAKLKVGYRGVCRSSCATAKTNSDQRKDLQLLKNTNYANFLFNFFPDHLTYAETEYFILAFLI